MDLKAARDKILDVVTSAYKDGLLTKDEFNAMNPTDKGPGKFYELFKVHKTHVEGKAPPERPIVSACGSITENIGKFVQVHLKKFSNTHHSYLQDSPDFLRAIEDQNESGDIEDNDILVTIDVTGLYTNIPQDQGIEACKDILENSDNSDEMNCLVLELLELVLKNNIFEFDGNLFQQNIGTSMGCKPAPDYANIFMAQKIDNKILEKSQLISQDAIKMFKRFLDDIFMRFRGTQQQLHAFFDEINKIHPSIKFTISHTTQNNEKCDFCDSKGDSIPFLDTQCKIQNKKIIVDLYKKPTDRNQYLLTSSCHPNSVTNNIPFSLALRIVRICSEVETRDKRLLELRQMLIDRDYRPGIIDAAITRAKAIPRSEALKRVDRSKTTNRPVFVVRFDRRLPSVTQITKRHWRTMVQDPYLKSVFPEPPLIAYTRPQTIRDKLIRAKVPPENSRPKRIIQGMHKCGKNCDICPYVKTGKIIKAKHSKEVVQISKSFDCQTTNLVYIIDCKKCGEQYIGQTKNTLEKRFKQHLGYVANNTQATGQHFNLPTHNSSHMTISVLEKVHQKTRHHREQRESHWIEKFNTKYKGMNKKS